MINEEIINIHKIGFTYKIKSYPEVKDLTNFIKRVESEIGIRFQKNISETKLNNMPSMLFSLDDITFIDWDDNMMTKIVNIMNDWNNDYTNHQFSINSFLFVDSSFKNGYITSPSMVLNLFHFNVLLYNN